MDEVLVRENDDTLLKDVVGCSACGKDHNNVLFWRFQQPMTNECGESFDYWCTCPDNGDPVLMKVADNAIEAQ